MMVMVVVLMLSEVDGDGGGADVKWWCHDDFSGLVVHKYRVDLDQHWNTTASPMSSWMGDLQWKSASIAIWAFQTF